MKVIAQQIVDAAAYYTIYVSFIILFAGIVGHSIDILVFTNSRAFRKNQSAFYLTAESIVDCVLLLSSFTSRIAINGFSNDLTQRSLAWCKLRALFATSSTLLALTIISYAAVDQYLSTSYYPYLKEWSTLKVARRLTYSAIIIWTIHGIPYAVLSNIRPVYGCSVANGVYVLYMTYVYYLLLTGFLPIVVMSTFATLAYLNVRRVVRSRISIYRRRLDRQLTAMILVRVAFSVLITPIYIVYRIYMLQGYPRLQDDSIEQAIVQLIGAVAFSLFYLNHSGSFYLFWISSERFRRQVKYVLVKKYWRIFCQEAARGNRIGPRSRTSSIELD